MRKQKAKIKEKIRLYLGGEKTNEGRFFEFFIITLNFFTVIVFALESFFHDLNPLLFWQIEIVTVSIFIAEYAARMWIAKDKAKHATNIYSIIDLVAIIPTFIAFLDLRFVRILRVFRIFRFARYMEEESLLSRNIQAHRVKVMRILFTIIVIIFVSSSFIYEVEKDVNPRIDNLGDAIYFSVVTLTTVGYGDIIPQTYGGKALVVLMVLVSVALIPWQFALLIREAVFFANKKKFITCQKCGLREHDFDASHCKHCGSVIYQEIDSA